jgi:hypothetical protein
MDLFEAASLSIGLIIGLGGVVLLIIKGRYVLALLSFLFPFVCLLGYILPDKDRGGMFSDTRR